jgi:hypothetical protein
MRFDIDRLQTFYGSPMGRMSHEMLAKRVAALWPSASGLDVLGHRPRRGAAGTLSRHARGA